MDNKVGAYLYLGIVGIRDGDCVFSYKRDGREILKIWNTEKIS